jgi:hypothetical protein
LDQGIISAAIVAESRNDLVALAVRVASLTASGRAGPGV